MTAASRYAAFPFAADVRAGLADVGPERWQRFLPGRAEGYAFLRAMEDAAPSDAFRLGAALVRDVRSGACVAFAPVFQVDYRLDTPLQGGIRRLTDAVHQRFPKLISIGVLALGSPMSDTMALGLDPGLGADERRGVVRALLDALDAEAEQRNCAVVALKCTESLPADIEAIVGERFFARVTSVPTVVVDLPFTSVDAYLESLPPKTAAYLRRKAKAASAVRCEKLEDAGELEPRLHALTAASVERSASDHGEFEKLDPDYFSRVKRAMGDDAILCAFWVGEQLVGFQLSLIGQDRIVAKQIGISAEGRRFNTYFLAWLGLVEIAIGRGVGAIELGATTYATKLMLGGRLERRWLYYKFSNPLVNRLARPAGPLFDFERNDPELKRLRREQRVPLA